MKTQMTHDEAVKICQTLIPTQGTPPENGWWMTSYHSQIPRMRWWNGEYWSVYCPPEEAEGNTCDRLGSSRTVHDLREISYYPRVWEGKFLSLKKG